MSTTPATTGAATADSTPAWPDTVDYVVIGAGAAGCVLASRLSEDPAVTVALVEIGPGVVDPALTVPANTLAFWSSGHDSVWPAPTTPQAHAASRVVPLLTGRGVGGGSSVNAMGWFQGLPADYDGWAADGAQGWSWADMQPYFRRIEDHELGASTHHAAGGPMSITSPRHTHPLSMAFLAAGRHLGWPLSQDLNGAQRTGVALASSNIRDGARHSVVDGYLTPARGRDNLVVLHQTQVTRIEVDGNRAVGVHLRPAPAHGAPARTQFLSARRGVVLCAGAIRTPQLLMLSGIGAADELHAHDIPVVTDLPQVGRNLQDHPRVVLTWSLRDADSQRDLSYQQPEQYYELARRGPWSSLAQAVASLAVGDLTTDPQALPSIHLGVLAAGVDAGMPPTEVPMVFCKSPWSTPPAAARSP
jgi:choline dehydrogenase